MTNFVNLTPHALNIVRKDGSVLVLAPAGKVARVSSFEKGVGEIDGIEITKSTFGDVVDLPDPKGGTKFIVSRLVAAAVPDRDDLLIPGPLLRDEEGKVVGCKGLAVL